MSLKEDINAKGKHIEKCKADIKGNKSIEQRIKNTEILLGIRKVI